MTDPAATRAYLTGKLDQLAAAGRDQDETAERETLAQLIADDRPDARQAIADALRLLDARQQTARDNA